MFHDLGLSKTQTKILEATVSLLKEKGYREVTVKEICKQAGIALGTFYHYFAGKDDLFSFFMYAEYKRDISERKEYLDALSPVAYSVEVICHLASYFGESDPAFLREILSPQNQSLSLDYYSRNDTRRCTYEDIIAKLGKAYDDGYFVELPEDRHRAIMELYEEMMAVFHGCVFEWCLNQVKTDVRTFTEKVLVRYLNTYLKEEYRI